MEPTKSFDIAETWYQSSFDALYPVVYAHRSLEAAAPEAAFAAEQLDIGADDAVLDLCCGNGRHMVHMRRHAARIAGLDYSADLLCLARGHLGPDGTLVRADMRSIPFGTVFNAVVSFFTSFGYFPTREENLGVVREVARVLKPQGRFFIDYLNAACVERTLVPESAREYNEYTIRERRWIDTERRRVNKITAVQRGGQRLGEWGESVQLYTEAEFRGLIGDAGLRVDRVFGDYDGGPLGADRPRMIVVGHKEAR